MKFIAFYLPQFHPIPENDNWWGRGFTEWTNVTKTQPLFPGHYQPHLPADLGFYDLRVPETRREQIKLAKSSGIDGFCYHYYWFSGKRVLERPLNDMLADPESDMPFCVCWANENWTRRWDAAEHEILLAQRYLPDDDVRFIEELSALFDDPRYIRIKGAPFFIVYRPQHLPDAAKSLNTWRNYCEQKGIGKIHICAALTHGNWDVKQYGFDSGVEFPPHNVRTPQLENQIALYGSFQGRCFDYKDIAQFYLDREHQDQKVFRAVFPSWDNTARRGANSWVVLNGTPSNYEFWLSQAAQKTRQTLAEEHQLLFINAWNEWAEGCHLEPDRQFGHKFLEATLRVKTGQSSVTSFIDYGVADEARARLVNQRALNLRLLARRISSTGRAAERGIRRMRKRLFSWTRQNA